MQALRWGYPWQSRGLLFGFLLWGLLPSLSASQELPTPPHPVKTAIPVSQQRIASSVRAIAQMVRQDGMDTARARMGRGVRWQSPGGDGKMEVYIYASPLTQAKLDTLRQHGVHVLRSE